MKRNYLSLAMIFALALAGCAKKTAEETQNPDAVDGGASGDQSTTGDTEAPTQSRARGSTSTRGTTRDTKARKITAKKPPRAPIPAKPMDNAAGPNGLLAEAFAIKPTDKLPEDFSQLGAPVESFAVTNLDIDEVDFTNGFPGAKTLKENYALRFSGSINIVEEAEYELCLHSDDGSQLLLENTLVVDNDGVHESAVESCELLYLAAGEYVLEVRYFQASGPLLTMHMAWAINGGEKVIVPTDVLFKPATGG